MVFVEVVAQQGRFVCDYSGSPASDGSGHLFLSVADPIESHYASLA
jgi:hypothetical protein